MTDQGVAAWLPVDAATFDSDQTVIRKGVEFHVFLSPYDLPEAVRGRFDARIARFVIEFRYLGEEESKRVTTDRFVTLFVGAHSKRLQRIEVDVRGLGATQVELRIEKAIDNLPSVLRAGRLPRDNFDVAKSVVRRKRPELLANLAEP